MSDSDNESKRFKVIFLTFFIILPHLVRIQYYYKHILYFPTYDFNAYMWAQCSLNIPKPST